MLVTIWNGISRFPSAIWSWNVRRVASSPIGFLITLFTLQRYVVQGSSMEPALSHGQGILVSRLSYQLEPPARGDIVVARELGLPDTDCIKRIVALPGEHVRIGEGCVFINDHALHEPYLAAGGWSSAGPVRQWLLDDREYLVLGDNRGDSRDSRRFGPLSQDHILGKAWLRYWPPASWGGIPHETPHML